MARKKAKLEPPRTQVAAPGGGAVDRASPAIVKKELRALMRDAFDQLGGVEWLVAFARKDDQNARTFVQTLSRLIPLELTGKDGGPLTVVIRKSDGTEEAVSYGQPAVIEGTGERVH